MTLIRICIRLLIIVRRSRPDPLENLTGIRVLPELLEQTGSGSKLRKKPGYNIYHLLFSCAIIAKKIDIINIKIL